MIDRLRAIAMTVIKQAIRRQFPDVPTISTQTLKDWLEQDNQSKPTLWDARSPEEYAVSHLPNAQPVPLTLADERSWQAATNAQADLMPPVPIVVYCSVGYRSARLIHQIQTLKQVQIFNLEGSLFEWANQGYLLYHETEQTQQVHPYNARWGRLLNSSIVRSKG